MKNIMIFDDYMREEIELFSLNFDRLEIPWNIRNWLCHENCVDVNGGYREIILRNGLDKGEFMEKMIAIRGAVGF